MPTAFEHRSVPSSELHAAAYVQSTDPGGVGAGKFWVDTSSGGGTAASPYPLKKRNAGDTGWDVIGGVGTFSSLSGVSISNPATAQQLVYDGTNWVNDTDAGSAVYAARTFI